ncbi:hypothetical protein AMTRI_Chr03g146300 [Amborella trichopoda]
MVTITFGTSLANKNIFYFENYLFYSKILHHHHQILFQLIGIRYSKILVTFKIKYSLIKNEVSKNKTLTFKKRKCVKKKGYSSGHLIEVSYACPSVSTRVSVFAKCRHMVKPHDMCLCFI